MSAPPLAASVRVVVCDDHGDMRAALRTILESAGVTVVGEAGDGDAAVRVARRERPDVVLMDVRMPGRDGIAATSEIVTGDPGAAVLVLTTFDDDDALFGALAAGAAGFVLKNSGPEEIVRSVRAVAHGDAVLDPTVARRVFARFAPTGGVRAPVDAAPLERLTERERDVLWLVARGLTNAEVAARLAIGEETVKTHLSRVLAKLAVRDRVQAVIYAFEIGFAGSERPLG
jgi:DNA-binding NarL/FixJ family response regulator